MPPSKFAQLQVLRKRHEGIRDQVKKTTEDLKEKIDSAVLSEEILPDCNVNQPKDGIWYWEKLINVLNVQDKLLDNKMNAVFGSSSTDFDTINRDLDHVEKLVTEIRSKSSLP
jgi:hypothetical protein